MTSSYPNYTRTYFFLRKKIPASHRAWGGTPIVCLSLGANRERKERVKGKASRKQRSRIGSALVCIRRNAQHCELKLPESTRFVFITVVMVAVSASGPIGCLVSLPPSSSQNIQSHKKSPATHRAPGETQTMSLALGENRKGKERVKGRASQIQSSRIGSALVCIRRKAQHRELNLYEPTRYVLITVLMVAVYASGPTGRLVSPPPLSSQNVQSHEKKRIRARGETPTTSLALGANREGKERVRGKASRI